MTIDAWDRRELCPDGGCIGVIGPDGTCRTCGKPAPIRIDPSGRVLAEVGDDDDDSDDDRAPARREPRTSDEPEGWGDRQLCDNGACVGVIGRDGTCSVCGAVAELRKANGRAEPEAAETADGTADSETETETAAAETAAAETADDSDDSETADDTDDAETADADDDRRLCPDGSCVGLVGADGACKVCGARP